LGCSGRRSEAKFVELSGLDMAPTHRMVVFVSDIIGSSVVSVEMLIRRKVGRTSQIQDPAVLIHWGA
jgi:hypothetical protein